ncbi:MAG: glycosyl transferase [Verrucomicrobiota bacterium]
MIGKAAYHLLFKPWGQLKKCFLEGGPLEQHKTLESQQEMRMAARALKAIDSPADDAPVLHFLTGKQFWYQTVFAVHSWQRVTAQTPKVKIFDDGSLEDGDLQQLKELIPGVDFQSQQTTEALLNEVLPKTDYPYLRERWLNYPNIRKLIDVHIGQADWKLVLDSDILFFRKPEALLQWCSNPCSPLHAIDCEESYGYPRGVMEQLCGCPIPNKLNVGLCGLKSNDIDWERLEHWTKYLVSLYGTHYYLEQALVAMIVRDLPSTVVSAEDYITGPSLPEALECRAVMHHYVANSKKWYFRNNWRRLVS